MNIAIVIIAALTVVILGFSVYVLGIISAKMDFIIEELRTKEEDFTHTEQEKQAKQFENLMAYHAGDRRNEFE